ncbi:MAG: hypothetical protein HZB25_04595 [Candidatus Eisenbacteria bacterium]|nr:hypothetical protein [Candidatus Eisenbacteria bacterium]
MTPRSWVARAACVVPGALLAAALGSSAAGAGDYPGDNGTFSADKWPNRAKTNDEMRIKYVPDPKKVGKCDSIYLCQTIRAKDGSGNVLNPAGLRPNGATIGPFEHLGDDVTDAGTAVDHEATEKDPYYNGPGDDGKDKASTGSTTTPVPAPTSMTDEPWIPDEWMPVGVDSVTLEFETCAICKGPPGQDKVLDCIKWTSGRHRGDPTEGQLTEPVAPNAGPPSQEFQDAKKKFEKNHANGLICPEGLAEVFKGLRNLLPGFYSYMPTFQHPMQPTQMRVDVVNSSGQVVAAIPWEARDSGGARLLGSGVLPTLEPFSYATVFFVVPPVTVPGELNPVTVSVDPANSIPEYDEADNQESIPMGFGGPLAVDDGPRGPASNRLGVSPSPFRFRTTVAFTLPRAAAVRAEVYDVSGARVKLLHAGRMEAGERTLEWDARTDTGRRAAAGAYLVRVRYEGRTLDGKVILLR